MAEEKMKKISALLVKTHGATLAAASATLAASPNNGDNIKHSNGINSFIADRVERTIQGARHGDVELARTVLVAASICLRNNTPMPNCLGQYLAEILEAVLEENDKKKYGKALKLVSKTGRNSQKGYFSNSSKSHKGWKRAVLVQRYVNKNIPLRDNENGAGAFVLVAEEVGTSEATIERAYYNNKDRVKKSDPETIEEMSRTFIKLKLA